MRTPRLFLTKTACSHSLKEFHRRCRPHFTEEFFLAKRSLFPVPRRLKSGWRYHFPEGCLLSPRGAPDFAFELNSLFSLYPWKCWIGAVPIIQGETYSFSTKMGFFSCPEKSVSLSGDSSPPRGDPFVFDLNGGFPAESETQEVMHSSFPVGVSPIAERLYTNVLIFPHTFNKFASLFKFKNNREGDGKHWCHLSPAPNLLRKLHN